MYEFFYNFYKKRLTQGLFTTDQQDGTSSPPTSVDILTEDSNLILAEDGNPLLTE